MTAKFADRHSVTAVPEPRKSPGLVLHSPRMYDLLAGIFFLGRERSFRERLLALAQLRPEEHVLDIGCGTGSMAILAKQRVGPAGSVFGVDASVEMIAQARRKAVRADLTIEFREAPAQALPFPDSQFDVVLSTLMFHHVSRPARAELAAEARRVLRPGGRLLVVDFEKSAKRPRWPSRHFHGSIKSSEIMESLAKAGFDVSTSGTVGFKNLTFALATSR